MAEYLDPREQSPETPGNSDLVSIDDFGNLIYGTPAPGMMVMAPVDEIEIQNEMDSIQSQGSLNDANLAPATIRRVAINNIQKLPVEMPQFIFQSEFTTIPSLFSDDDNVVYKYDATGKMLIDTEGDGYPIIEVSPKNIEFESQTFREKIDCNISDDLLEPNPLPDSAPIKIKVGSRNFAWIKDEAGKRLPNSNYWQFPDSPSPEQDNLIDFTYVFYKNSSPLFFIFDAINYNDLDSKLPVNTGLKYKISLDGEVIKEGDYLHNEYVQLFNAQPKDEAIQTITAEVYNDFGSKSVNQKFQVVNNDSRTKNYIWCWDDCLTRPSGRTGGLVSLDYDGATSADGTYGTFSWDWRRTLIHMRCTNYEDIPEYYKDAWQVEIIVYAPNYGITINQYGTINTVRDDTGTKYRPRKRIFTLREIHEREFMTWADPAHAPTIELNKIGRMSGGRPTPNTGTGDQHLEIPTGKSMKKKLIPFTIFEDQIYFDRNNDPSYPFNDYKEPV
jgi:hypothetical protein